jgi:hypothetical protein
MSLLSIADDIQPNELTDTLLEYWKLKTDGELARELKIDNRVKVAQYRKRRGTDDIQYRIIVNLLRDIGYLEKKLEAQKKSPG